MRVNELQGGDIIRIMEMQALYVGASPHPTYKGLAMVVWKLQTDGPVEFSVDALSWHQDVGELVSTREDNVARLFEALNG